MSFEKTFIVGDIHGCRRLLERLLERIKWDPQKHRLIFVGDYIDRGEDPKGVIELITGLRRQSGAVDCLMGNHEHLLLEYLKTGDPRLFLANGGRSTLESYGMGASTPAAPLIPAHHLDFLGSLKPYLELEEYLVVHAGLRPGVDLTKQDPEDLLWIRDTFIQSDYDFGRIVVFGHTPFHEPLVRSNKIGIDTGAVYGNKLTCLELPGRTFVSVQSVQA